MDTYVRVVSFLSRVAGVIAALLIGLAVLVICEMVIERYVLNVHDDLADRRGHLLHRRRHLRRQRLRADDARPRQRGHPAAVSRAARALLARALHHRAGARLLHRPLRALHAYWYEAYTEGWLSNTVWRARLWIPYLSMPIGLGLLVLQYIAELLCLLTGRALPFGLKPKEDCRGVRPGTGQASLGRRAVSPTTQGALVLVVTLLMLLSGIPVAFGLGAISVVFLLSSRASTPCTWSPRPSGPGSTSSRWSRSRCS